MNKLRIALNSISRLELNERTLLLITLFTVGAITLGLLMDFTSFRLWRRWQKTGGARPGSLPFMPWLFYAMGSFFLFLRGAFAASAAVLLVFTLGHVLLHARIRSSSAPLQKPLQEAKRS